MLEHRVCGPLSIAKLGNSLAPQYPATLSGPPSSLRPHKVNEAEWLHHPPLHTCPSWSDLEEQRQIKSGCGGASTIKVGLAAIQLLPRFQMITIRDLN